MNQVNSRNGSVVMTAQLTLPWNYQLIIIIEASDCKFGTLLWLGEYVTITTSVPNLLLYEHLKNCVDQVPRIRYHVTGTEML